MGGSFVSRMRAGIIAPLVRLGRGWSMGSSFLASLWEVGGCYWCQQTNGALLPIHPAMRIVVQTRPKQCILRAQLWRPRTLPAHEVSSTYRRAALTEPQFGNLRPASAIARAVPGCEASNDVRLCLVRLCRIIGIAQSTGSGFVV